MANPTNTDWQDFDIGIPGASGGVFNPGVWTPTAPTTALPVNDQSGFQFGLGGYIPSDWGAAGDYNTNIFNPGFGNIGSQPIGDPANMIPINNDSGVVGSDNLAIPVTTDPSTIGALDISGLSQGSAGNLFDPNYGKTSMISNDQVTADANATIAAQGNGFPGVGQLPLPIPIPGIGPLTAAGLTILLNGGLPSGSGGGGIQSVISHIGDLVMDPLGSVQNAATNVASNIGQGISGLLLPTTNSGVDPSQIQIPSQTPVQPANTPPVQDPSPIFVPPPAPPTPAPEPTPPTPTPPANQGGGSIFVPPDTSVGQPQPAIPVVPPVPATQGNGNLTIAPAAPSQPQPAPQPTAPPAQLNPQAPEGPQPTVAIPAPTPAPATPPAPNQGPQPTNPTPAPPVTDTGSLTVLPAGSGPAPTPQSTPTPPSVQINPTTGSETPGTVVTPLPGGGGTTPVSPPATVPPIVIAPVPNPTTMPTTAPTDRSYYTEGNQTNTDNSALLPGIFGNYQNYSGGYGNTDQTNFTNLLAQLGINNNTLTGYANQQTAAGNTALRTGNVQDASALGGQALGTLQQLNPNQYAALNQAQGAAGAGSQPSAIQQMLQQQAIQGLQLGSGLSAQDTNQAQQAAREAWSARGLVNSPGAVGDEILNTYNLGQQRLQQRQGLAQSVDSTAFGQQQQGYGNILQNASLQSQAAFNPFSTITSANTTNQGSNANLFNQGSGFSSGQLSDQNVNGLVNPFNPYAQDVYGSNFNAANARTIAAGNNAAAMAGANSAASGELANSFLRLAGNIYGASCWIAREIYGEDDPKWMQFRDWLFSDGPRELVSLYLGYGRQLAEVIKFNPMLKPEIRAFMDSKIAA